jgi:molybdopterin-guanine dinucleotide biosynthesis protein A
MPGWFTGVVLVGGESRRFGGVKVLEPVAGVPMALRVARALLEAGASEVILAAAPERLWVAERLEASCTRCRAALDPPGLCRGPLAGIIAGAAEADGPLVVAPGDAAWLTAEAAGRLAGEAVRLGLPAAPLYGDGSLNPLFIAAPSPESLSQAAAACTLRGGWGRAGDALRASAPGFAAVCVDLLGGALAFHTVNTRRDLEEPSPPPPCTGPPRLSLGAHSLFLEALRLAAGGRSLYAALYFESEARHYRALGLATLEAQAMRDAGVHSRGGRGVGAGGLRG